MLSEPPLLLLVDLWRILLLSLSLWTGALLIRVGYLRYIAKRVSGDGAQHWTVHVALTIGVFAIGALRVPTLGEYPDGRLYLATFLLLMITYGVTRKFRVGLHRRPVRRR